MYKTFIYNKALFVLILLAVIQIYIFSNYQAPFMFQEDLFFKSYVERAGGYITDETYAFIEVEEIRFAEIEQSVLLAQEKRARGEMSESDYGVMQSGLQQMLAPRKAFELFKNRVIYIEGIENGQVIYEKAWNELMAVKNADMAFGLEAAGNVYNEDMTQALLILIFIVLIVSPVYSAENENNMTRIISATPKKLTWLIRFFVNFMTAVIVCLLVSLPFLMNTLSAYGADRSGAVIQSMPAMAEYPLAVSIRGYMILLYLTRIIGAAVAVFIIQTVSMLAKKKTTSFLISMSLLALPAAIYFAGTEFFAKFGLNALLGGNAALQGGTGVVISGVVILAICGGVLIYKNNGTGNRI
jgi:hypothetical protein